MQINIFLNLMIIEQEKNPYILQNKTTKKVNKKVIKEIIG